MARIETFHSKGMMHRDIKPDNFTIGRGENQTTVYIIDYGLVKRYRNPKTKIHIPYKQNKKLTGTARYSSINTHMGIEQSRRDDIECIGYTLIYLAKGELPWQGIKADNKKEKYNKIMEKKCDTPIEVLCKGLPSEFIAYMYYCRALQFEDKPDYSQLRTQFRECFRRNHFDRGFVYDWIRLGVDLNTYKKAPEGNESNKAEEPPHDGRLPDRHSRDISNEELQGAERLRNKSAEPKPKRGLVSQEQLPIPGLKLGGETPEELIRKSALSIPSQCANQQAKEEEEKDKKSAGPKPRESLRPFDFEQLTQGLPSVLLRIAKEAKGKSGPEADLNPAVEEEGAKLAQFVAANKEKEVRLEDKMKNVPAAALMRKVTRELSDRSSCNFKFVDIIENIALFGIFPCR